MPKAPTTREDVELALEILRDAGMLREFESGCNVDAKVEDDYRAFAIRECRNGVLAYVEEAGLLRPQSEPAGMHVRYFSKLTVIDMRKMPEE